MQAAKPMVRIYSRDWKDGSVPAEGWSTLPSTWLGQPMTAFSFSSRGSNSLSWSLLASALICTYSHIIMIKNKLNRQVVLAHAFNPALGGGGRSM